MLKTKCHPKAKHDTKPGRVKHISLEEYYETAPEQAFMKSIEAFVDKAAEAEVANANEMDLDELDAYILANTR